MILVSTKSAEPKAQIRLIASPTLELKLNLHHKLISVGISPAPCYKETLFWRKELAYLPHRRRNLNLDDENIDLNVFEEANSETAGDTGNNIETNRESTVCAAKWRDYVHAQIPTLPNSGYSLSLTPVVSNF